MNISTISYWFYEAFESMKKNIKNVLISIGSMIATMIIIAAGYLLAINSGHVVEQRVEATSKIRAYLDIGVSQDKIDSIQTRLNALDGVQKVEYISQDEAIKLLAQTDEMMVAGYPEEVLKTMYQPYITIVFKTVEAEEEIINTLKTLDGVGKKSDDISVPESAKSAIKVASTVKVLSYLGVYLIICLSVFLMMNFTKIILYARRKEISIMKYVGARDTFIKVPFAIEGIVTALIAAVVVILIVTFAYEPIIEMMNERATYKYLTAKEVLPDIRLMLVAIACFIGGLGSTLSMNKYLDV